jgi:predicted NAD-dependent protein-ADP-ribosyltransferase YbiA (DUF1768 family)
MGRKSGGKSGHNFLGKMLMGLRAYLRLYTQQEYKCNIVSYSPDKKIDPSNMEYVSYSPDKKIDPSNMEYVNRLYLRYSDDKDWEYDDKTTESWENPFFKKSTNVQGNDMFKFFKRTLEGKYKKKIKAHTEALLIKFVQQKDLQNTLKLSKGIIEYESKVSFWGETGQNILGKLLMCLRYIFNNGLIDNLTKNGKYDDGSPYDGNNVPFDVSHQC